MSMDNCCNSTATLPKVFNMTWCCHVVKNAFQSRLSYGEFLVSGFDLNLEQVVFLNGFNMCHRKDYTNVIAATQRASELIEAEGISNFKLSCHSIVYYCKHCGTNLRTHYGEDGGVLRDDEYIRELQSA